MALLPDAWLPAPTAVSDDAPARAVAAPRDEVALARIYADHAAGIQRFLRGLLGCPVAADDATQETFARAFRRWGTLREGERVVPWLFGIARNVSLEARKARRRDGQRFASADDDDDREDLSMPTPEAELLGREAARVIDRALLRLTTDRRAALLLRLDHGLAYDDIAATLGWSLAKVKVEIHRARAILREELASYRGDAP